MLTAKSLLKQLVMGMAAYSIASLTAQAQIFTGEINFVGGATLNNIIGSATTFESFYGPSGSGGPQVLGGADAPTGAYAGVPGATPTTFNFPFTFNPSSPFALWNFTFGSTTYTFQVTSVTFDTQLSETNFAYINVGGVGTGTITGWSPNTTESWSITGTTANSTSLAITIGSSANAVPEPGTLSLLLVGGVLLGGRMLVKGRQAKVG